ncbi:MAG: transglutaminase family protein [Chloroflexota bacterium]
MHLAIRYVSLFRYPEPAWDSHNVLRACPIADAHQKLIDYRLDVDPRPSVSSHVDAWGTRVDTFAIRDPHRELRVIARSEVETSARPEPTWTVLSGSPDAWRATGFRDEHWMWLQRTHHTKWGDPIATLAERTIEGAHSIGEVITRIDRAAHGALVYQAGATHVGAEVEAVLAGGKGVCQDFVHLALSLYRAVGVPARYVSGYFYAVDVAGGSAPDAEEIAVQTHAWLEVAVPGWGWWALDPTNLLPAGERHVKIGHGRDYDDVLPLRGVYYGTSQQRLSVEVGMSRGALGPAPRAIEREPAQQQQQQQQ